MEEKYILIIDDLAMIIGIFKQMIARRYGDYAFLEALNGREALRLLGLHGERIELVLMDLGLPDMSGEELFERLLALKPDARVIVVSGDLPADLNEPAPQPSGAFAAARAIIHKPCPMAVLHRVIGQALED